MIGVAGVGKSYALDLLEGEASADGYLVIRIAADRSSADQSLGLISSAVSQISSSVWTRDEQAALAAVSAELIEIVDSGCDRPLAIFLDDMHLAGGMEIDWFVTLRRSVASRVVVILAGRRLPDRLLGSADAVVDLEPMALEEAVALASNLLNGPPGPLLKDRVGSASGIPAAIVELVASAKDDDLLIVRMDGSVDLRSNELPHSMMARLARRIARLGPEAQEVAYATAVLGLSADVALVTRVANVARSSMHSPTSPFEKLFRSGILDMRADQLVWSHELVRESVLGGIPAGIRTDLERRACLSLLAEDHSVARIHDHLERSNATQEERRDVYERSTESENSGERLRALRWLAQNESRSSERREALLQQCCSAAEDAGASDVLRWASTELIAIDETDGVAWQRLAFSLMAENRMPEAIEAATLGLDKASDAVERAKIVSSLALAAMTSLDSTFEAQLDEAAVVARTTNDPEARIAVGSVRSRIAAHRFDTHNAIRESRVALEALDDPTPQFVRYQPHFLAALALLEAGETDGARELLHDVRVLAVKFGFQWAAPTIAGLIALTACSKGDGELAERAALDGIGLGRISNSLPTALFSFAVLARLRLQAGENSECEALLDEADQLVAAGGNFGIEHITCVGMELLHLSGRSGEALELGVVMLDLLAERLTISVASGSAGQTTATAAVADDPSFGELVGRPFTTTEQLVATKLAAGCSNREIAAQCFMSVRTAESHVARVLKKVGARSRTQAIGHLSYRAERAGYE